MRKREYLSRDVHYSLKEKVKILAGFNVPHPVAIGDAIEDFTFKDLDKLIDALMVIARRREPIKL